MLNRVWFAETWGCLVSGLVSRQPNRWSKNSWKAGRLFLLIPENADTN